MKKIITSLSIFAAMALSAVVAQAAAPTILVVDMAKLYDSHYKTEEQNAKLRADEQKAQEEIEKMNKDGNVLVEEYKGLSDQANNPSLTDAAKAKSQGEAAKKLDEIQRKKNEIGTFAQNTQRSLQQRLQNFRSVMLEEISKIASDVGKRKGATLLLDKAGPTLIGVSSVIYADASYEITDDVMKEINKDRPAASAAPAPAPAAAPAATETPKITVPGVSTK
ncbi:MAG: OmpH family outer membrane protein [Opitutaceae bacterium]|nr:OmpH family outer membrane protein [Opitutaceae bacterium]